jgi:hypothetical protein
MRTSVTKIMKEFERFATAHNMIKTFGVKPIEELISADTVYPLMWINTSGMNATYAQGEIVLTIPVYMLDRVERDWSNRIEVMSSTLLNMNDFYTYYTDNECTYGFYFGDNGTANKVGDEYSDILEGYTMDIICKIANSRNENEIPLS